MNQTKDSKPNTAKVPETRAETNAALGLVIVIALGLLIGMATMWQNFEERDDLPQLVLFLGQFHPLLVHLPITLLIVVFVMETLSVIKPWRGLRQNTGFLLWIAALGASFAIVVGYMLVSTGDYPGVTAENHMWAGIAVAAGSLAALMLKTGAGESLLYRFVLLLTVCAVVIAAHLGGSITHGRDYLTKHLPDEVSEHPFFSGGGFWGVFTTSRGCEDAQEDEAGIYAAIIFPILDDKCIGCHNADKAKGKLNMEDWEALMKGGDSELAVIVAGDPAKSEMVARLHLPLDDDDHMPPEDKDQPTEQELRLIEWWIRAGGTRELKLAELEVDEEILAIIESLPEASSSPQGKTAESKIPEKSADPAAEKERATLLANLAEKGFDLRPVSAEDGGLIFNAVNVADDFDDAALALFEPLAGEIIELNLARTKVSDQGAVVLGRFTGLKKLHLEETSLSDAALAKLGDLDALEYINLFGTAVTDAGLKHLAQLEKLQRVYLWKTGVTEKGAQRLRDAREGVYVDLGWKQQAVATAPPAPPAKALKTADAARDKPGNKAKGKGKPPVKPKVKAKPKIKAKPESKPKTAPKTAPAKAKKPAAKPEDRGEDKKKDQGAGGSKESDSPPAKEKAAGKGI